MSRRILVISALQAYDGNGRGMLLYSND